MMVAVPNIFTRNQLEVRFRTDIEATLAEFFERKVHLAVLVDDSLDTGDSASYAPPAEPDPSIDGHRPPLDESPMTGPNSLVPPGYADGSNPLVTGGYADYDGGNGAHPHRPRGGGGAGKSTHLYHT